MRMIVYIHKNEKYDKSIVQQYVESGYQVKEYVLGEGHIEAKEDSILKELAEIMENNFVYYAVSTEFYEVVCRACVDTGTKYLIWISADSSKLAESSYIGNMVNYYVLSSEYMVSSAKESGVQKYHIVQKEEEAFYEVENFILNKEERNIYQVIDSLYEMHKKDVGDKLTLKSLATIKEEDELHKSTDSYFAKMEEQRELKTALSKQVLDYLERLLKEKSWNSWREILLWIRRHEIRELMYNFWQFFLIKKCVAIYSEETLQYYENGDVPSVIQIGSFTEMYETYFKILFLLRRLCYNIAPDEESEIIEYIYDKKISGIFIKHVVEHNQIEDKGKVYHRLGELLRRYE